jgi:hypothetical protein
MHEAIVDYTEAAMKLAAVQGGVMVLLDIALFTLGIMLLQRREIARKGAIAWAIAALVVLIGRAAAFELVMWPKLRRFMDGMNEGLAAAGGSGGPAGFFGLFTGFAHAGQCVSLVAMAVFPLCLLVFMNLASTRAQVRARVTNGGARQRADAETPLAAGRLALWASYQTAPKAIASTPRTMGHRDFMTSSDTVSLQHCAAAPLCTAPRR